MPLPVTLSMPWFGPLCVAALLLVSAAESWAAEVAATASGQAVEELQLETSDGIRIAAWYYPVPEDAKAVATVILVHDLEGSHKTVDNLARNLQRAGCAVVAPDLRCHGGSGSRPAALTGSGGKSDSADPRLLKKIDLESIAAATGGRLRGQSALRGESATGSSRSPKRARSTSTTCAWSAAALGPHSPRCGQRQTGTGRRPQPGRRVSRCGPSLSSARSGPRKASRCRCP